MSAPPADGPPFCPSCGYNLRADQPIERGPWRLLPDEARFHGVRVALVGAETIILYTLAAAAPRAVTHEVLANRSSGSSSMASTKTRVARIRDKLGDQCPIESEYGIGYRWAGD